MPSWWSAKASYTRAAEAKDETAAEYTCDEHLMSLAELASRHDTRINLDAPSLSLGLSAAEAATRLHIHGKNQLAPPKTTPAWMQLLLKFKDKMMLMLLLAGALSQIGWGLGGGGTDNVEGIVLYVVVVFTCIITWLQDRAAANVLASIKGMLSTSTVVIREGHEIRIPPQDLVPGDIVRLHLGDL